MFAFKTDLERTVICSILIFTLCMFVVRTVEQARDRDKQAWEKETSPRSQKSTSHQLIVSKKLPPCSSAVFLENPFPLKVEAGSLNEVVHAAFATASLAFILLGYSVQRFLKHLGQFSTQICQ